MLSSVIDNVPLVAACNGMLKISRKYMVGEVEIEGLFVEVMGNMPYGFLGSVNANVRSGAGCGRYLT